MALNVDLDGFGILSDSDVSELSPTLKQQPPVSPIESESSSGISSLDSDDLKKQLLSSPTISHDDEDQQSSDDGAIGVTGDEKEEEKDSEPEEEEDNEDEIEQVKNETTEEYTEKQEEKKPVVIAKPLKVFYQNRDILDLSENIFGSGRKFVQYTVMPENNVNFFFQNRAQYWRLNSTERQEDLHEDCPCCDFTYPSTHLNQGPTANINNAKATSITDSLLTFLKNSGEHLTVMPNNPIKRMMGANAQQYGYQMPSQQPPQQYQPQPSNGFYNNSNNSYNGSYNHVNPFLNNNNNSNIGTTMALLNLMNNASRNAANAFQAMNNSAANQRYFNNNMNNGYGLYKQF